MNDMHIDGLHLALVLAGFAIGLGFGYLYGWLHFSGGGHGAR